MSQNAEELNPDEVKAIVAGCGLFAGETLVLAKNENSELIEKVKPCNIDFLDSVFNRLMWDIYDDYGLAKRPYKSGYMVFLNSEAFFIRNTQERFLNAVGAERKFRYADGRIVEYTPANLTNALFTVLKPLEMIRNAFTVSLAAMRINSELDGFESHLGNALSFWRRNAKVDANRAPKVAKEALDGAASSMRYSLMSSISASYGIRLREKAIKRNLMEVLIDDANRLDQDEMRRRYGYFSLRPYDVSRPYLWEDPAILRNLASIPPSSQLHYILRENAKMCASMHLAVLRKCYQAVGESSGLGPDVFFLRSAELKDAESTRDAIAQRKSRYEGSFATTLPPRIAILAGKPFFEAGYAGAVKGLSAGARTAAVGRLVRIESTEHLVNIAKGDVIASRHLSPDLVVYYGLCSAVISQTGGRLAHAAIVALEQNLPCIVQVDGFDSLKDGSTVSVDGETGKITVLGLN
jgi:phosphohistidine swiveling domain-containing protein